MDVRVLRYFLAVAREENITRAAESLHIAQPSLSRQLMELERELGKQLLIRGKRKIRLTEEGVLLRKRAEEILELVEKTELELRSDPEEISGDIYLGGSTPEMILQAAALLRTAHPEVRFHFYSGDAVDVSEKLDQGSLDFAVMLEPVDDLKYNFLSLPAQCEWGILMNREDVLASQKAITRETLRQIPLITHQRIGLQQKIAHWAETDLENLHIAATYNVVHGTPISFVQQGLGYFLTTRDMLAPVLDERICFRPLTPSLIMGQALVWKKHAVFSKAARAFYEQISKKIT